MKKIIIIIGISLFSIAFLNFCDSREKITEGDFRRIGDSIVTLTFDTLRAELFRAMAEKGIVGAVDYCRIYAIDLTKIYEYGNVTIRRAAIKFRNPSNQADELESEIINNYINSKASGDSLYPIIIEHKKHVHYFKPIILQSACLPCHGKPFDEIPKELIEYLQTNYPNDQAKDFKVGDLRGVWHIRFDKN